MTETREEADLSLIQRARQGDRGAMEKIYSTHSGAVYAMALRLTGCASDAEDVVQETFIKAWTAIRSFQGRGTLRSWLLGIGINLTRDMYRLQKRIVPLNDTPPSSAEGDVETRHWLEKGLLELAAGYREVLTLHDVLGLRHAEIAALLGISEGTSKSQLHKARAGMRALLSRKRQRRVAMSGSRRPN